MTRLQIPPPSNQTPTTATTAATIAQTLRPQSEASAPQRADFREALADANDRAAQRREQHQPESTPPADDASEQGESQTTEPAGEKPEESPSDSSNDVPRAKDAQTQDPAVEHAQAEHDPSAGAPDGDGSEPADPAPVQGEVAPDPPPRDADDQIENPGAAPLEQPRQTPQGADPELRPSETRGEASVRARSESGHSEDGAIAPGASPESPEWIPAETENQRHFRAVHAPSAEDQAKESIQIATRFDAAIRDRIRHAAKVDLAALAAAKLTTPTEATPGAAGAETILDRQLTSKAHHDRNADTGSQPQRNPAPTPQQFTPAPSDQTRAEAQPAPTPAPREAPAPAGPQAATAPTLPTPRGGPTAPTLAPVAPAVPGAAVSASRAQAPTQPFDRAITALRSLGADKAAPRSKAPPPQAGANTPGARAETGKALLAQVSRGFASILRDKGGSLSIRLRPDTLGELKINLRVQGGGVEATFKVDNAQARDLLQSNLSQLKQTLESSGVRVDHLRVELDNARTQDAAGPRAEYRGHGGDGSPGFDDPSETGGRDGDSRQQQDGSRGGAQGRAPQHGAGDSPPSPESLSGLDAEADRDAAWIGLDTLA